MCSKRRAGPSGERIPCSQALTVRRLTPIMAANSPCERRRSLRMRFTSGFTSTKVRDGSFSPRRTAPLRGHSPATPETDRLSWVLVLDDLTQGPHLVGSRAPSVLPKASGSREDSLDEEPADFGVVDDDGNGLFRLIVPALGVGRPLRRSR